MNHELTTPIPLRLHTTARVRVKCDYPESVHHSGCYGRGYSDIPATDCEGQDYYEKETCPHCHGTGTVTKAVSVDVDARCDNCTHQRDNLIMGGHICFDGDDVLAEKQCDKWQCREGIINALLTRYENGETVQGIEIIPE